MTDPIAEAAAQNEPSLLARAEEKIHELEAKLEHMIHPDDAAPSSTEPMQEVAAAQVGESSPTPSSLPSLQPSEQSSESAPEQSASSAGSSECSTAGGEQGNAASSPSVDASPATEAPQEPAAGTGERPNAAPTERAGDATPVGGEEVTHVVAGATSAADSIRSHLSNIKRHLSARGFEIALVQDIHNEIAAIEKYL